MKRILVLCSFVLLGAGCASQQDLDALSWEVNAFQTQLKQSEERSAQKDRLVDQALSQQAHLQASYTEIMGEIQMLQGRLDEISAMESAGSGNDEDLVERLAALEQAVVALETKVSAVPAAPVKSQYELGIAGFRSGDYEGSMGHLKRYLKESPDESLTDNAYFWIGECLYALGRYEDAVLQYDYVLKTFKKSEKNPACLLKQAMAWAQMGDRQTGELLLNRLIKDYPASDAAAKGKAMLKKG